MRTLLRSVCPITLQPAMDLISNGAGWGMLQAGFVPAWQGVTFTHTKNTQTGSHSFMRLVYNQSREQVTAKVLMFSPIQVVFPSFSQKLCRSKGFLERGIWSSLIATSLQCSLSFFSCHQMFMSIIIFKVLITQGSILAGKEKKHHHWV